MCVLIKRNWYYVMGKIRSDFGDREASVTFEGLYYNYRCLYTKQIMRCLSSLELRGTVGASTL